jgi:hypothetical protein
LHVHIHLHFHTRSQPFNHLYHCQVAAYILKKRFEKLSNSSSNQAVHAYNPITWEAKAEGEEFEVNLDYIVRPCPPSKKNPDNTHTYTTHQVLYSSS